MKVYPKIAGSYIGGHVGMQGMMADDVECSATKQTAFTQADAVFMQVSKLRARIDDIVTRLAGSVSEACTSESPLSAPVDGLLDDLNRSANSALQQIDRAHEALSRLERAI